MNTDVYSECICATVCEYRVCHYVCQYINFSYCKVEVLETISLFDALLFNWNQFNNIDEQCSYI